MALFKNVKIMAVTLAIVFSIGACGSGGGSTGTTTVVGLSTADNTQLLND